MCPSTVIAFKFKLRSAAAAGLLSFKAREIMTCHVSHGTSIFQVGDASSGVGFSLHAPAKKNIVSTSYFTDNMDLVKTSSNILMHVSMKCDGPSSDLLWKWLEKISLAYARSGNYPSPTVCKKCPVPTRKVLVMSLNHSKYLNIVKG